MTVADESFCLPVCQVWCLILTVSLFSVFYISLSFLLLHLFFLFFLFIRFVSISCLSCIEMATSGAPADVAIDPAHYSVRAYLHAIDARVYSAARRFGLIRYGGDKHFIFDSQMHEARLTDVGR